MLTDFHIQLIENDIKASGVYMKNLSYDMLDHLCCSVEYKMEKGLQFEEAYQSTKLEFSPNGYDEIQEETKLLLTLNSQKMKKVKSILGLSGVALFILGTIFGKFHLPGTGVAILLGTLLMVAFLLTQLKTKYLEEPTKQVKILQTLTITTSILLVIGLCFYKMHWPGAKILFGGGLLILTLGIAPLTFKNFQSIISQLTGAKVAIGIAFVGGIMLAFTNTGNSTNYYRTMAITDDEIVDKTEYLIVENNKLNNPNQQKNLDAINKTYNRIELMKQAYINVFDFKENYSSDSKNVRYLINNDLYSNGYFEVADKISNEVSSSLLYNEIQQLQDSFISENNLTPIISISQEEWEKTYFKNKMLFGIFMYLDHLQYELKRMEREVLLYL